MIEPDLPIVLRDLTPIGEMFQVCDLIDCPPQLLEVTQPPEDADVGFADEVAAIDPRLFDFLYALRRAMDSEAPFHVISGYRSPGTNARLRQRSKGVAKRSLHMRGMAVDVRLPGRELKDLMRTAKRLNAGGVGYYPKSNFIHVDTGRVRFW